jgi:double-stranded uracil-DNA glycosylase
MFWPTLFDVGLTPRRLNPNEYPSITHYRLGLTDLAKNIAGVDNVLKGHHFGRDALREKIRTHQPHVLAFTSKRAAEEYLELPASYGQLKQTIGTTALFVLPSPSGAARRYWSNQPWRDLAQLVG